MRIHLLSLAILVMCTSWASAQYPARPLGGAADPGFGQSGPTVSPYINLLRSNSSTLANYYGLVRPELQVRQQVGGLAQQQGQLAAGIYDNVPTTGSSVRFMNTQPYFMSTSRGGTGGGLGGAAQGVVNNPIGGRTGAINANSPFGNSGLNGPGTTRAGVTGGGINQ